MQEVSSADSNGAGVDASGSMEDLLGLGSSLTDAEYLKDLEEATRPSSEAADGKTDALLVSLTPLQVNAPPSPSFAASQPIPASSPGCVVNGADGFSETFGLNGLLESMETGSEGEKTQTRAERDGETELDGFPILARSMSTSRRHSWGVPLSPITLGRRSVLQTTSPLVQQTQT